MGDGGMVWANSRLWGQGKRLKCEYKFETNYLYPRYVYAYDSLVVAKVFDVCTSNLITASQETDRQQY